MNDGFFLDLLFVGIGIISGIIGIWIAWTRFLTSKPALEKPVVVRNPQNGLISDRVEFQPPDIMVIELLNQGDRIWLEDLAVGDNHPATLKIVMKDPQNTLPEIGEKSRIELHIRGKQVKFQRYHFILHYRDSQNQHYSQEIMGLGRELPVVDRPQSDGKVVLASK